eukprot:m.880012 g.880012  ORF g.880012 m.880012 type:complete len:56 (+) comp59846_c0_seq1:4097-4264(+)
MPKRTLAALFPMQYRTKLFGARPVLLVCPLVCSLQYSLAPGKLLSLFVEACDGFF